MERSQQIQVINRTMTKLEYKEQLYVCLSNIDNLILDETQACKLRLCINSAINEVNKI